jgi:phosphonate transport system permease protein
MSTADFILPSKKYKQRVTTFSVTIVAVALACIYTNFNPIGFFLEFHYVRELFGEMMPPNYHVMSDNASTWYAILQTLSMAFLGSLYGGVIAVVIAFLAAQNTMPFRWVRLTARFILSFLRVIPILVVILIFVIAVGPSTFAGMLTLVIVTIGNFGKLFTEIIENVDNPPAEAIFSVGASRMQVIRYSIVPQILPNLIANLLFAFDVNIRAAIGLGIFGGGGIGFQLQLAKSVLHYKDVTAIVSLIIVMVILAEKLSDYLRRRILGEGDFKS